MVRNRYTFLLFAQPDPMMIDPWTLEPGDTFKAALPGTLGFANFSFARLRDSNPSLEPVAANFMYLGAAPA